MSPNDPIAEDARGSEELFQATLLPDYDDETGWNAVRILRRRNTEEVFHLAVRYCRSAVPLERARGLDVLAQLGAVVHSASWALAHLGGDAAVTALIPMRNNSDPGVRWAVTNVMHGTEREDAITTLIELMDDVDDNVRDWATFALGTQCSVDSPAIQDALRKRLTDTYQDARDEAVWGLAQHKDLQGIRILIERLNADVWIAGDEMAAAKTLGVRYDTPVDELLAGLRRLLDA